MSMIYFKAIPHKERLATLHAICLQISLQSLFRIFPHASCVHIFRDISGKYSKIHKGFSPFFPSSLKKSDDAICIRQIRNRLSYFTKMLVNTSSIHSAFCFIWRKIWRRICRTIFVRYCLESGLKPAGNKKVCMPHGTQTFFISKHSFPKVPISW